MIDAAFAQRRKTLRAALSGWAGSPAEAEAVLVAAEIDPKRRGETVSISEFARIAAHRSGGGWATTKAEWEQMYGERDQVWSGSVNRWLAEIAADLPPGRALDLGAGEGGDALWLAERGWRVVAVDISDTAIDRGRRAAAQAGLEIEWISADLTSWTPPGSFDLVSLQFVQGGEGPLTEIGAQATRAVAVGGRLLTVTHAEVPGWASEDAHHHHGKLPDANELLESLWLADGDWEVEVAEVRERIQQRDGEEFVLRDSVVLVRRLA